MHKLIKLTVITFVVLVILTPIAARASAQPVDPAYTMTIEAQWNPAYAAGNGFVFHIGATIANVSPAMSGPIDNKSYLSTDNPVIGQPTLADVPTTFTLVDDNVAAQRIGTTIGLAFLPFFNINNNQPFWVKNEITDANNHTLLMYTYYPNGIPADDSQPVTTYILLNNQVHQLTAQSPTTTGDPGPIDSFTDTNVRLLADMPDQMPQVLPEVGTSGRYFAGFIVAIIYLAIWYLYHRKANWS